MNIATERSVVDRAQPRDQHAGEHGADADQDADGNEELQRIVEVAAEPSRCGRRARPSAAATGASAR